MDKLVCGKYNYMSPQELEQVIGEIPSLSIRKWKDKDVEYLFRNMYWMALRPMEGINLSKEDFHLDDGEVFLGKTKTVKFDKASIPVPYIPQLRAYLATKDEGRLVPGLTYMPFYMWLKKLGKMCNIEAWTSMQKDTGEKTVGHIFRKSLGKDMRDGTHGKKFNYDVISKQLRHSDPVITMKYYLKASTDEVKEAWNF